MDALTRTTNSTAARDEIAYVLNAIHNPDKMPNVPAAHEGETRTEHHLRTEKFLALRHTWCEIFGVDNTRITHSTERGGTVDFEDWVENAVVITKAISTGRPCYVTTPATRSAATSATDAPGSSQHPTAYRFNDAPESWPTHQPVIKIGSGAPPVHQTTPSYSPLCFPAQRSEWPFLRNPAYLGLLGREAVIATNYENEESRHPDMPDLFDACCDMGRRTGRFVAKNLNDHKISPIVYAPVDDWTPRKTRQFLYESLEYTLERTCLYLVQSYATITHEMRVIIVDGELVCSAGCIEHLTPLDNEARIDPKLRKTRCVDEVVRDQDLANELAQFAVDAWHKMNAAASQNRPVGGDICIDVALINGRPGIVEVNPLSHLGLYAMDATAMIGAIDRAVASRLANNPPK